MCEVYSLFAHRTYNHLKCVFYIVVTLLRTTNNEQNIFTEKRFSDQQSITANLICCHTIPFFLLFCDWIGAFHGGLFPLLYGCLLACFLISISFSIQCFKWLKYFTWYLAVGDARINCQISYSSMNYTTEAAANKCVKETLVFNDHNKWLLGCFSFSDCCSSFLVLSFVWLNECYAFHSYLWKIINGQPTTDNAHTYGNQQ